MIDLIISVVVAVSVLVAVVAIVVFAGAFPHVFMSLCFFAMFCFLVVVVHEVRKA